VDRWLQVGEVSFGRRSAGKTQRITITLPQELADELLGESTARTTTVSAVVREAVAEYFARRQPEGLPEFVGMVEGVDPADSERIEEILAEMIDSGSDPPRE